MRPRGYALLSVCPQLSFPVFFIFVNFVPCLLCFSANFSAQNIQRNYLVRVLRFFSFERFVKYIQSVDDISNCIQ